MRIFKELTPECDSTAQMYASGLEKKEIAQRKFRALSTIRNQLQTAYLILHVRNGRELAMKMAERLTGQRIIDWGEKRAIIAAFFLLVICVNIRFEAGQQRVRQRYRVETVRRAKD
jgi:DNA-binding CsgD family transcriptional regulator